jgi:hypothetical protein
MPALDLIDLKVTAQKDLTYQVLDSSDTFTFSANTNQLLLVRNTTGGAVNATFIGADAPSTVVCQGVGDVAVTAEVIDFAADGDATFYLNAISTKLQGGVTITGGAGLEVVWASI